MSGDPTLHIDAETLRTLHRIHRQRSDLKGQLRRGPLQIQAGQTSVNTAIQQRDAAKETLKKARMNADQRQLQLRGREQRVEELKVKLNQAASNKEYQLIKDQIAADQQANSVLADEILEILEQIDVLVADVASKEAELKDAQAKHVKLEGDVEAKMKQAQEDLTHVERELGEVERLLPPVFLSEYQRVVATRGEDALASVEGGSCTGCYQTLTVQFMNRLQLNHLVNCPNCGALLYLPEDRSL